MNRIISVLLILAAVLSLSGCSTHTTLKDRIIIEGLAVDYEDGRFIVTIQNYKPSDMQSAMREYDMHTASGRTIFDAVQNIDSTTGQRAFFSNIQIIILSRSVAELGLSNFLDFFVRHEQIRKNVSMVCAEGKASELLDISVESNFLPSERINKIINYKDDQIFFPDSQLMSVAERYLDDHRDAYLPLIAVNETEYEKTVDTVGVLCFDGNYPSGVLKSEDAAGFNWICGYTNNKTVIVETDNMRFSLSAKSVKKKIVSKIYGGKPYFDITVNIACNINEISTDGSKVDADIIRDMVPLLEDEVCRLTEKAVDIAFGEFDSDIFDFGTVLRSQQRDFWLTVDDWSKVKPDSEFSFKVNAEIYRAGRESRAV